ncbi:MAG: proteasome ATPase, partial [Acidimicrobiales bacterium]|nr:proteasome ATPase [Acidimicrobiales bacterium]
MDRRQGGRGEDRPEDADLREQVSLLEEEILTLRRRLQDAPRRVRTLEEKLLETKGQLQQAVSRNEKLVFTLQQAKEQIAALKEEVEKLTQPPSAYGTFLAENEDGTVDVFTAGRKMRVAVHPEVDPAALQRGAEVVLNESLNVLSVREAEFSGEVVTLKELLDEAPVADRHEGEQGRPRERAVVVCRADEERVVELSAGLVGETIRPGDSLLMDSRTGLLLERLPRPEVEELVLEEVPDVTYADVGGLDSQ